MSRRLGIVALAFLTGCGLSGSPAPTLPAGQPPQSAARGARSTLRATPRPANTWCGEAVVITSEDTHIVGSTYPGAGLCILTGSPLVLPASLFVAGSDNLWVADAGAKKWFRFAPGTTTPSLSISDPLGHPTGVAVDSRNGTAYLGDSGQGSAGGTIQILSAGVSHVVGTLVAPAGVRLGPLTVDDAGNVYAGYHSATGAGGGIYRWLNGRGAPSDIGVSLTDPSSIQTTSTGTLVVCDRGSRVVCGFAVPGQTNLTRKFLGKPFPHNIFAALDSTETVLLVQRSAALAHEIKLFPLKYPQLKRIPDDFDPLYGAAVHGMAVDPPAPAGAPF